MSRTALGLVGCVVVAIAVAWPSLWTAVDDAFISARYAEHLVQGHGWTYNASTQPVEGFSNPLWVMWIAVGLAFGAPVHAWMVGSGLVAWMTAMPAAWLLARDLADDDGPATLLAPWLLACSSLLAVAVTNGLETGLWLSGILWSAWGARVSTPRWDPWTGAVLGLCAWVRPEGVLIGLIWLASRRVEGRPWRRLASGWLVVVASLVAWRLAVFGAVLPNTAEAKIGARGWAWIAERNAIYLRRDGPIWPLVAGVLAVSALHRGAPRGTRPIVGLAIALVLPALGVELWMPGARLLTPAYVLAAVLVAASLARHPRLAAVAAVVGGVGLVTLDERARVQDVAHSVLPDNEAVRSARWLAAQAPPDATAAVRDAGAFAYGLGTRIRVYETHEHALTRPHGQRNATGPLPVNPTIVVVTLTDPDSRTIRYPPDARIMERRTVPYRHLATVRQHPRRYYALWVREDAGFTSWPPPP